MFHLFARCKSNSKSCKERERDSNNLWDGIARVCSRYAVLRIGFKLRERERKFTFSFTSFFFLRPPLQIGPVGPGTCTELIVFLPPTHEGFVSLYRESVTRANRITLYFPLWSGGGRIEGRLKRWTQRERERENSWRRARNAQRNQQSRVPHGRSIGNAPTATAMGRFFALSLSLSTSLYPIPPSSYCSCRQRSFRALCTDV